MSYSARVEGGAGLTDTSFFTILGTNDGYSWDTSDASLLGTYTVTVTATAGCSSLDETYTVDVMD